MASNTVEMANRNRKQRGKGRLDRALVPGSSAPSNPQQHVVKMRVPIAPILYAATAGNLAVSRSISLSAAQQVASYQNTFDEFRIVAADIHVQSTTIDTNGVAKIWLDENDGSTPSAAQAASKEAKIIGLSPNSMNAIAKFHWRCQDLADLPWFSMASGTANVPVTVKMYSTPATYGASTTNYTMFVDVILTCEFRGIGGP